VNRVNRPCPDRTNSRLRSTSRAGSRHAKRTSKQPTLSSRAGFHPSARSMIALCETDRLPTHSRQCSLALRSGGSVSHSNPVSRCKLVADNKICHPGFSTIAIRAVMGWSVAENAFSTDVERLETPETFEGDRGYDGAVAHSIACDNVSVDSGCCVRCRNARSGAEAGIASG
jgi:hypothetical protein